MTTKHDVANRFGVALHQVEQVGSKQLFKVRMHSGSYLVSYTTIVGKYIFRENKWHLTGYKYSPTTSKQLTMFKRENPNYVVIAQEITEAYTGEQL
jgi:hypothetical protein